MLVPPDSIEKISPLPDKTSNCCAFLLSESIDDRSGASNKFRQGQEDDFLPRLLLDETCRQNSKSGVSLEPNCLQNAKQAELRSEDLHEKEAQRTDKKKDNRLAGTHNSDQDISAELIPVCFPDGDQVLPQASTPLKQSVSAASEQRYLTGVELGFAALIALSGIVPSKRLNEAVNDDSEEQETENKVDEDDAEQPTRVSFSPRKSHIVRSNETLQDIAEEVYHNRNVAWLIADLNAASLKEEWIEDKRVVEIRNRQRLELPAPDEAANFISRLRKGFNIDRLITVVCDNTLDRRVLNLFLGSVSGLSNRTQLALN